MMSEQEFPSLELNRNIAVFMAKSSIGTSPLYAPMTKLLASTFVRLVDSAIYEYNLTRESYFQYYNPNSLGPDIPVSKLLLPMLCHIENCISNTARAINLCNAVRTIKITDATPLVKKSDWKDIPNSEIIRQLRNDIQHMDNELKNGNPSSGVLLDKGKFQIGPNSIEITKFCDTLKKLHEISFKAIEQL